MNILVVGSTVIDLFLEIEDKDKITVKDNSVSLRLGDKIPVNIKKLTLGGDGANISVGLKRFSFNTTFFTFLGNDLFSKKIEETIKKEGINMISEREGENTSLSMVINFDRDRIIFSHRETRSHNFYYNGDLPDFIYLASIGNEWKDAYEKVLSFAKENNIPLAFTPGSPQLSENSSILIQALGSKIVFINREEAEKILKFQDISFSDIKDVLIEVKKLGMEVLSVTDGSSGSYALDNNGNYYFISSFGEKFMDRVGAGDAYTSGFLSGYLMGLDISECMRRGCFNAYSVISKIGAQEGLLTKKEMDKISEENKDFKAERI